MSNTPSARSSSNLLMTDSASADVQHVLKVGGSLLDLPDLSSRILALIHHQNLQRCLLVIGGGAAADEVRLRQKVDHFDDVTAHWSAIDAMSRNAHAWFSDAAGFCIAENRGSLTSIFREQPPQVAVVDATPFLQSEELGLPPAIPNLPLSPLRCLPANWSITSDSIAVWIAIRLNALNVWFLKSCDPVGETIEDAVNAGQLDPGLLSFELHPNFLRWINLRSV
ncbi:MAG: hypothetical protein JNL58_12940 [Planctomyces sp.]|nr:hypothetical protein [Planctomyces sp.]